MIYITVLVLNFMHNNILFYKGSVIYSEDKVMVSKANIPAFPVKLEQTLFYINFLRQ